MTIAEIGMIGIFMTGYAGQYDILKPEYQKKEQAVRRFIESFENTNIPYDIQTKKYTQPVGSNMMPRLQEFDEYAVIFQEDIQGQLDMLDKQVLHDTFLDYFDDERHSFTVAVLMVAETTGFRY